jgi:protein-tyrosine phosphatase
VLVHCEAGRNRSGLVTALYLIRYRGYRPQAAIELVIAKRGPNALWNGSFLAYLRSAA